jgi:AraC-like DNA-binding protein
MDELSLTEIAKRVGYRSTNAFATAFQRHYGDPPGTWRHGQRVALTAHAQA